MIVAEEITSRFFNVISLFNSSIPLIAIKMTAIENPDESISLLFTKVLDLAPSSQLEEDEPTPFTTISFILPGVQRLAGIFNAPLQLFRRGAFFEKVSQLKKGVETV